MWARVVFWFCIRAAQTAYMWWILDSLNALGGSPAAVYAEFFGGPLLLAISLIAVLETIHSKQAAYVVAQRDILSEKAYRCWVRQFQADNPDAPAPMPDTFRTLYFENDTNRELMERGIDPHHVPLRQADRQRRKS
jgi:hypothetical protein